MKFKDITPELLFDLTKEALNGYPVDISDLQIDENEYLKLVCLELLDRYSTLDDEDRQVAMLAANVSLVLENFILSLKLLKLINKQKD
jgi:hypothetical protein